MRYGRCPKCNSATIYSQAGGIYFAKEELFVETGDGWFTNSPFVSFLCASCGYFENYVADPGQLAKVPLDKNWQKVPVHAA